MANSGPVPMRPSDMEEAPGHLKYFNSETLSDITIRYGANGDRVFYGHRILLCGSSYWFQAALTGNFKESNAKEITLLEDDPEALYVMFRYPYDVNTDEHIFKDDDTRSEKIMKILRVYEVSDKYCAPEVQDLAYCMFRHQFTGLVDDIKGGKLLDAENSVSDIIEKIYELAGCTQPPRHHPLLHEVLKSFIYRGKVTLDPVLRPLLISCVENNAEFGRDAFLHELDHPGIPFKATCNRCKGTMTVLCTWCTEEKNT